MTAIRAYRSADEAGLRHVCLLTGHAGDDARPHTRYPDLLPDTFAVPYAVREPELCFVVDDGSGVVGYIVGTADTVRFADWFTAQWLPRVAPRYPAPQLEPTDRADWDEEIIFLLHHPDRMVVPEVADYPAHLHIDLLPPYQGKGLGRQLMDAFLAALRDAGVPAVHLSMVDTNTRARAFYDRCGFSVIDVPMDAPVTWLGRRT
jgi:ribosomal protein S18 acetylase RimI-like enzyme